MTAPKKFLFDTSFEPADDSAKAAPKPQYFDEDLARARDEGHAAGREEGRQEALAEIENAAAQAQAAIGQALATLREDLDDMREQNTRMAVEVAVAVIRKIYPRLADNHAMAEIEAVVADAIARLGEEPRIVVRVSDALLDPVRERVGELTQNAAFEGRVIFLAQDDMAPGDVRIEWADGGAERDTERLWQEIDELIRRMARPSGAPNGGAAEPEPSGGAHGATD